MAGVNPYLVKRKKQSLPDQGPTLKADREPLPKTASRKPAKASSGSSGMSYTPSLPKAASSAPKPTTGRPRPSSSPDVAAFKAKQQGLNKGSSKPAYQPSGTAEKRGAVTSTTDKNAAWRRAQMTGQGDRWDNARRTYRRSGTGR